MYRNSLQHAHQQHAKELFEADISALFAQVPILTGFCIDRDLHVTELAVHTWPGANAGAELRDELEHYFQAMVEEDAEAADLLRGRTFARSLQ